MNQELLDFLNFNDFEDDENNTEVQYDTLVMSGGGVKGFAQLGVLYYYELKNQLQNIKTYVGTSIGAINCLLLAAGYSVLEIYQIGCEQNPFKDLQNINLSQLNKTYGLCEFQEMVAILEEKIKLKYGYIPTLGELYHNYGIELITVVYNTTDSCGEYLSYRETPALSCVMAVVMSANIPLVFSRIEYNGRYYIDGGIFDNCPVKYIDDNKHQILAIQTENFGMKFNNIFEYFVCLLQVSLTEHQKTKNQNLSNKVHLITIKTDAHAIDLNLTAAKKEELFSLGFQTAKSKF